MLDDFHANGPARTALPFGAACRALLVEDDALLGPALSRGLEQNGFAPRLVANGGSAEAALRERDYDVIVLDIGLPDIAGDVLVQKWRGRGDTMPVLVLTARSRVGERVRLLDLGADDYLVKPFDLTELCARLRALLRRSAASGGDVLQHGPLTLHRARRRATLGGTPLDLTQREFSIVEALLRQRGGVLSRRQLEELLYGWGDEIDSNAIEVHIHHLRRKLGRTFIVTVRGMGYRLVDEGGT